MPSEHPRDPRSRAVTETIEAGKGAVFIHLECGHIIRRRPLCSPSRVICRECKRPAARPAGKRPQIATPG